MKIIVFLISFLPFFILSQTGGQHAFSFLELPQGARAGSLGRELITVYDDDVNLGVQNPAVFNSQMSNSLGVNQALLAGGIFHGMVAYARDINKLGTGALHLRYVSYGTMDRRDENGDKLGTFSAGDFALGASLGRPINEHLAIGASFNLIWSQLESYNSMGLSVDFAGLFKTKDARTTVSAVVRNIGAQLTTYTEKTRAPLPINVLLGVSHKLEHAPFRFSVVMHHLNKWDLTYYDPNEKPKTDPLTGEIIPVEKAKFGEKLGRHFIFQIESLIGKVVRLRVAFDYNQRREMLVPNRSGIGGFSFGAGLNFKRFAVDYGLYCYSTAGYQNLISLRTNLSTWRKKGVVAE